MEARTRLDGLNPESLLELAHGAPDRFKNADSDGKRELLSCVCSNCEYTEEGVQVSLRKPFDILLNTRQNAERRGGDLAKSEEWLPD